MIPPIDRSRLGLVLTLVGAGLLLQGWADALARTGHGSPALPIFLLGICLSFAACAWRLTSAHAARGERIWVSVVLGMGLLASYVMLHPLLLDSFDELLHFATLTRLLDSRALFPSNTFLPVSPYYPGLELATAATRWITGLPLVVSQLVVLAMVRLVLVLGVFLVVERACRSSRAGGIGVLVYAAGPQFYGFVAQYAYETLALAFAVGVVYLLIASIDAPRTRMRLFALALACIAAVVITHHVTGWLTVGFLVVWAVGLFLRAHPLRLGVRPLRRLTTAGWGPSLKFLRGPSKPVDAGPPEEPQQEPSGHARAVRAAALSPETRRRRKIQARIVGLAAAVGVIVGGAWTWFVGGLLTQYVGPVFSAASAEISQALGNGHGDRTLFRNAAGGGSPGWEIALILAAALAWCLILLPSLYSVVFKRSVRGGALRFLPAVIAALYPLSLLANVSSNSKLVAERATAFIFFGVAVVLGAWLGRWIAGDRRIRERVATIVVATVVFLGSLLFAVGPLVSLLPGPYRVGADQLSYGSPSLALARWADTHIPAGSHVAVDKDNGDLLNALAGVVPVTKEAGLINPELIYFDRRISLFDIYLIRKADVRYIVVDDRLAQGPPLYGTYIAEGEPPTRLSLEQLDKFDTYPSFIKRIYDNGPIQVYDVTSLLHPSARPAPAGPPAGGTGFNVGICVLAGVVSALWLLRLRRRREPVHDAAHLVVCGVLCALVVGVFGAFLVRLTHVKPEVVALVVLVVLLMLSVRPQDWRLRDTAMSHRLSTGRFWPSSSRLPAADGGAPDADSAATGPSASAVGPGPTSEARPPRVTRPGLQMLLGILGIGFFVLGATFATVASIGEWTPPPELSISTTTTDHSVAQVQLGSAGPIAASLEVTDHGRTIWRSSLERTTAAQGVDIPARVLRTRSRVKLVSGGHTLRVVDG